MTITKNMFTYHFYLDEKEIDVTCMRIYGIGENNENICIRINNFTPYVYIELPPEIQWTQSKALLIINRINSIMGDAKPLKTALTMKYKLYGAHMENDVVTRKKYPYLFCAFSSRNDIRFICNKLKKGLGNIVGVGSNIKLKVHEQDADPILQFVSNCNLPTSGWITFNGEKVIESEKITLCQEEYIVKYKNVVKLDKDILANPKIMSFDIEVNSSNPTAMPNSEKVNDKVFQISCIFSTEGSTKIESHLLTLGQTSAEFLDEGDKDIVIHLFKTEADLIVGFTNLIKVYNPNLIVGYNILGFDIPYLIARAKFNLVFDVFDRMSFHKYNHSTEKTIKWSSSAYKNQEFLFLDTEGRLFVDLLPLVKRDYKLDNYKLKTVSSYFIGDNKKDLPPAGIFKCYRIGTAKQPNGSYSNKSKRAIGICGSYCVKDSILVVKLMSYLQIWTGLCEMAKTFNCQIFSVYTQGQQIKVYSQVYKYALEHNFVVEKDGYETKEHERYVGAHVFPPVPGIYNRVMPFDFASLYPTTIIAYNIDYSTLVTDPNIPDSQCYIMKWEDHIGCEHDPKIIRRLQLSQDIENEKKIIKSLRTERDKKINSIKKQSIIDEINKRLEDLKPYIEERSSIQKSISKHPMCAERNYRFLKSPPGVLPTILHNLLNARKQIRTTMKQLKKKPDETGDIDALYKVLDKRQLAYKISANSMYGAMGVNKGYLPFMPGAMCTTFMGRTNIEIVAKTIPEKYGGQLVYGDTDSNYIHFPHLKTAQESWDYAEMVAEEVSQLFRKPIKLEFEEAIYWRFFIASKKRYIYTSCKRDGIVKDEIGKKGVLLARRDCSVFVRNLYEQIIKMIFNDCDKQLILFYIIEEFNKCCSNSLDYKNFVVTKSVGSVAEPQTYTDEKGNEKILIGDYKVPKLSKEPKERSEQLKKKEVDTEDEFYDKCLPAQVQLALKMRKRGQIVQTGSRIEYIISNINDHLGKQYDKIEDFDYFKNHSSVLTIDFFYYIKSCIKQCDELLNISFSNDKTFKPNFIQEQYNFRYKIRRKVLDQFKSLFSPKIVFIN